MDKLKKIDLDPIAYLIGVKASLQVEDADHAGLFLRRLEKRVDTES